MLKNFLDLFKGYQKETAPKTLPTPLNPALYRPSFNQVLEVDFVQGAIQSALHGDMTPLLGLYRDIETSDGTIQSAITTRKLAVMANGCNVTAAKGTGTAGDKIAAEANAMLDRSESFIDACTWMLHGGIWPVSIVERKWVPGGMGFSHPEFRPVPLELYDYRTRSLRIRDVDHDGNLLATSHMPAPQRYITHRGHMLMAPDHWGGPMRALVFWSLFSTQDREWWARFLERNGSPFLVGKYDKNDDDSRLNLVQAFQEATRLFGIVATRETEVEIHEVANSANNSAAFSSFWECAKAEKLLLILGQTLSGQAQSTGLGSGVAGLQSQVRQDVRLWDAFKLAVCVRNKVIKPWMALNDIDGPVPMPVFGGLDPERLTAMASFLESLGKAGLQLTDEAIETLSRLAGINLERVAKPDPPTFMAPPPGASPGFPPGRRGDPALTLAAAGLAPSTVGNEAIALYASAGLSRAWGEEFAALDEIVATSTSRGQCLTRAAAWLQSYQPRRSQELIAQVLEAHAANASVR